jgi:hypothetical protein
MTKLQPKRFDRVLVNSTSIALLVEVGLITIQYWRGVASHFNHSTNLDVAIEGVMLGLILCVTLVIFYLTLRTRKLLSVQPVMALAIRSGMVFLSLSCLLGILTTALGEISIAQGNSYELWGRAGVLKFPHGVALHAIQLLPILAWFLQLIRTTNAIRVMQAAVACQVLFLTYAIWQTGKGRDRFNWDIIGGLLFLLSLAIGLYIVGAVGIACIQALQRKTLR